MSRPEVDFGYLRDIENSTRLPRLVAQMDRDIDRTRMIAAGLEAAEAEFRICL